MNNDVLDESTVFDSIKQAILNLDPVYFCEKHLTLDGHPFRLRGNGYKPFVDMYRHIGVKALNPTVTSADPKDVFPILIDRTHSVATQTRGIARIMLVNRDMC